MAIGRLAGVASHRRTVCGSLAALDRHDPSGARARPRPPLQLGKYDRTKGSLLPDVCNDYLNAWKALPTRVRRTYISAVRGSIHWTCRVCFAGVLDPAQVNEDVHPGVEEDGDLHARHERGI